MGKKNNNPDKTMDYRVILLQKITKGLKKLKHHSLQKTIRLLKDAEAKKDDTLKKKVTKLEAKLQSLKKVSPDDLKLMTLFQMELEFKIKQDLVDKLQNEQLKDWRSLLDELIVFLPKQAAGEEIDLEEGNNAKFVGILNFYELIKTKQHEAFKELTEMIETLKTKAGAKTEKNSARRALKKQKVASKKGQGEFKPLDDYLAERKVAKVIRDVEEGLKKEEKLKAAEEKKAEEKKAKAEAKVAAQTGGAYKPVFSKKLGNKPRNTKSDKSKDQTAGQKPEGGKPFEKKTFNDKAKSFNKDRENKFGSRTLGGAPSKRPDNLHPSWQAMVEKRERDSNVNLKSKAKVMEIE